MTRIITSSTDNLSVQEHQNYNNKANNEIICYKISTIITDPPSIQLTLPKLHSITQTRSFFKRYDRLKKQRDEKGGETYHILNPCSRGGMHNLQLAVFGGGNPFFLKANKMMTKKREQNRNRNKTIGT